MATEEQIETMYAEFTETDEMAEWDDFRIMTTEALERDPDAETVTVPAAFLRRVITEIATQPLIFSALLERHNQLCDQFGIPEEKYLPVIRPASASDSVALQRDVKIHRSFPLKPGKRRRRKKV